MCAYLVDAALGGASGLYLHAPEMAVPAQDEVEAFAVSVGLGDSEAEAGCLAHEGQFGEFSLAFAVTSAGWSAVAGRASANRERAWQCFFMGKSRKASAVRLCQSFLLSDFLWDFGAAADKEKGAGVEARASTKPTLLE